MDWIAKHISSAAGFCFGGTYEFDSEHSFYMPPFVFWTRVPERARQEKMANSTPTRHEQVSK